MAATVTSIIPAPACTHVAATELTEPTTDPHWESDIVIFISHDSSSRDVLDEPIDGRPVKPKPAALRDAKRSLLLTTPQLLIWRTDEPAGRQE